MKLIMVSTDRNIFDPNSGVTKRFKEYSEIFDELHIIVFTKKGFKDNKISENVFVYPTNSSSKIQYISDAVKIGSRLEADIVSAQDCFLTGIASKKISKKIKAKLHLQIHTDIFSDNFKKNSFLNKVQVFIAKILLKKAHGVRVVSKRIAMSLKSIGLKIEPVILPIAIDLEKFDKDTVFLKRKFDYNVLTVSRLESEKNVEMSVLAFALIARQRSDVGLTIIGSGSLKKDLEFLIKNLGIENRIEFVGNVSNTEDYYKNSDLYIQSSKYEGYGMSLVEAALCGLAIITTDIGVVGEFLIDGGNVIVAKDNPVDFAEKILSVLSDDNLRQNIGRLAKDSALQNIQSKEEYLESFKNMFSI